MDMPNKNPLTRKPDMVNHPPHYTQGGIECIEAIKAATVGKQGFEAMLVGNVIKYLWRYESKGGIEDVEKALWYLTRLHRELVDRKMSYHVITTEHGTGLLTPWKTQMIPKDGDMFTQNQRGRAGLLKALLERGGYCPCQTEQTRDTMCPCKTYRENGECKCGMFVKIPQNVQPEETLPTEEVQDAETKSIGVDSETEDSKE